MARHGFDNEGAGMPVTAGELRDWLVQFPADTPIVIDVNTDEGVHLFVDDIRYSSDEGPSGPPSLQIEIGWEPPSGWIQHIVENANETRRTLGLPPLM
jgi:hypothetical protein